MGAAALVALLLLSAACANPGAASTSKPETVQASRAPLPTASPTTRPWYAERLEKLGFFVFPAPVDVGDFAVETLTEGAFNLSAAKGKVVLLNFWASWCPPCRAEMPSIQRLWDKTKAKPFTVIAISIDDDLPTARAFVEAQKYSYPIYYDASKRLATAFNASSIPTTYVLDKSGKAIAGTKGSREYDEPQLAALFEELAAK